MDLERLLEMSLSSLLDDSGSIPALRCMGMNFTETEPFPELDYLIREAIPKPKIEGLESVFPSVWWALQIDDENHDLSEADVAFIDIVFAGEDFQAARIVMILTSGDLMSELDDGFVLPEKLKDWMSRFMDDSITLSDRAIEAWDSSEMGPVAGIQAITIAPVFREDAFLFYVIEMARVVVMLLARQLQYAIPMTLEYVSIDRDGCMRPFSQMEAEWFEGALRRLGARRAPYPDHDFDLGVGHCKQACPHHPLMIFIPKQLAFTELGQ